MKFFAFVFVGALLTWGGALHAQTVLVYDGLTTHTFIGGNMAYTQRLKAYFVFSLGDQEWQEITYFPYKGKKYYNVEPMMPFSSFIVTDDRHHDYKDMVNAETDTASGVVTSSMLYLTGRAVMQDYTVSGPGRLIPSGLTGFMKVTTDSSASSDSGWRISLKYDKSLSKQVNGGGGGISQGTSAVVSMLQKQGYIQ